MTVIYADLPFVFVSDLGADLKIAAEGREPESLGRFGVWARNAAGKWEVVFVSDDREAAIADARERAPKEEVRASARQRRRTDDAPL